MVIEAWKGDRIVGACEVPDWYINDPDLPYLTDQIDHRKEAVDQELAIFRKKIDNFFKPWDQVECRLVFQSKMNENE